MVWPSSFPGWLTRKHRAPRAVPLNRVASIPLANIREPAWGRDIPAINGRTARRVLRRSDQNRFPGRSATGSKGNWPVSKDGMQIGVRNNAITPRRADLPCREVGESIQRFCGNVAVSLFWVRGRCPGGGRPRNSRRSVWHAKRLVLSLCHCFRSSPLFHPISNWSMPFVAAKQGVLRRLFVGTRRDSLSWPADMPAGKTRWKISSRKSS